MMLISIIINLAIFISTLVIIIFYFRKDGQWNRERGLSAFRYFTCLSNAFCAAAALLMAVSEMSGHVPYVVWLLKYLGTVSLTVTMMTVLLFLGPTMGGYKALLSGNNLYMHLLGPLLAIISFCFLEKGKMDTGTAFLGLIPVIAYGLLYLYKVIYAPEEKRWPDFYGFNRNGKWPVSYAAMVAGTIVICLVLRAL